jgi:aryl-alcohol dehydrogenase-like predicted oxidoreductase
MQKQGATKIMSDLDSALWKRITQIVDEENRSFSYCDFVPKFEVDGQSYSIAYGTFRNKISEMLKAGKIQLVCYSPQAFYTLKGQNREEALIHVLAHELRHMWQVNNIYNKRGRAWSAKPAYAIKKMREWRKIHTPTELYPATLYILVLCSLA